ncbi:MAG: serine hydrolase domain-containing protein [Terracidiphilus sp.]
MRRSTMLAAAVLILGVACVGAKETAIPRPDGGSLTPARIDATVTRLMDSAHVTGAGVAVFHHGKIVYLKAYGLRDTEKGLPLTPDSVMTSASLSKAAFATVVAGLAGKGLLDLDRPIAAYLPKPLPDYPAYADLAGDERWRLFTLRILLSHTAGFANFRGFEPDLKLRIHFQPGTRYAYSGEGIELAQFVVETATGRPLQTLMQEYLFQPDAMTRTSMVWEPRFESDFANGYDEFGRSLGPERRSHADAAGSMQTTLRDYAAFLSALLRNKPLGAPATGSLFDRQIAIHSAHQFPSLAPETTSANDAIRLSYGLGWGIYSSPWGEAFFKEGHDEGWRHLALLFREHGDGILILTNSSNGEGVFKPLIDQFLGPTGFPFEWEGYTPWDKLPPLPKLKQHTRAALTPAQLERVAGRYALGTDVVLTATVASDHLLIRENDETPQEYLPESAESFYSTTSTDVCTFPPSAGPAQFLVLHLDDGRTFELKRLP